MPELGAASWELRGPGTLDRLGAPLQAARYAWAFMRPRSGRLAAALLAIAAGAGGGCGSHHGGAAQGGDDGGDDGAVEAGGAGDDAGTDAPAAPGDGGPAEGSLVGDGSTLSDCVPEASLLYVVTEERELYSFDPGKNQFNLLASVDCANGSYANSMAIDRAANAWINYGDGSLWKVSTKTGACTATGFVPNQQGVGLFGMGFAAKSPGSNTEQLFICDLQGGGLGYIDLSTMTLMRFGPFAGSLAGHDAELSGTGDARLFGFFAGSPLGDAGSASVAQLDPSSEAATQQWTLPTLDTGSDWAFSFWGGDFYLYTANKYDQAHPYSSVTRFRPSDGSLTVMDQDLGFRIVGAGSSTCAPTTPTQ